MAFNPFNVYHEDTIYTDISKTFMLLTIMLIA